MTTGSLAVHRQWHAAVSVCDRSARRLNREEEREKEDRRGADVVLRTERPRANAADKDHRASARLTATDPQGRRCALRRRAGPRAPPQRTANATGSLRSAEDVCTRVHRGHPGERRAFEREKDLREREGSGREKAPGERRLREREPYGRGNHPGRQCRGRRAARAQRGGRTGTARRDGPGNVCLDFGLGTDERCGGAARAPRQVCPGPPGAPARGKG